MGRMPDSVRRLVNLESANGHAPELGSSETFPSEAERVESNGPKPAEALSGVELLVNLIGFIRRYVALSEAQVLLSSLWIVHTHALEAADTTAYLNIRSAEKRSGKTRLLETLSLLVARPWLTGRVTSAVLVRKVAAEMPALLLDESDAAFKGDREYAETLRGVLNAGFRRGGVASLCIGQGANLTYKDFPVFCPKAIAGIGTLPDTVADRSIPIELRRRRPSERVERFRLRKGGPEALPLQKAAARWAQAHLEALVEAEPELPEELDDRAQDIIEPLLAIAEEGGGAWPVRARDAAVALLTGEHREDSASLGVRLLRDCRTAFDKRGEDSLATGKLLERLRAPEDAPWRALQGEALDASRLARMLKPYGIRPKKLREGEGTFRGYCRAWFEDAWARYLPADPEDPEQGEQGEHPANGAGSDVPGNPGVPGSEDDVEHDNSHDEGDVPPVPSVPGNQGNGGEGPCHLTDEGTISHKVAGLFADCPERLLKPLAAAVSLHLFSSAERWREVLPEVRNAQAEASLSGCQECQPPTDGTSHVSQVALLRWLGEN